MSTQLNAASRLRTEVKAAPVEDSVHHTYMASLYTQMIKVLRRDFPEVKDIKEDFKLTNKGGKRIIVMNALSMVEQKIDIPGFLKELGWVKTKKMSRGVYAFSRKDGSWPLLVTDVDAETKTLSLAPVDNFSELKSSAQVRASSEPNIPEDVMSLADKCGLDLSPDDGSWYSEGSSDTRKIKKFLVGLASLGFKAGTKKAHDEESNHDLTPYTRGSLVVWYSGNSSERGNPAIVYIKD